MYSLKQHYIIFIILFIQTSACYRINVCIVSKNTTLCFDTVLDRPIPIHLKTVGRHNFERMKTGDFNGWQHAIIRPLIPILITPLIAKCQYLTMTSFACRLFHVRPVTRPLGQNIQYSRYSIVLIDEHYIPSWPEIIFNPLITGAAYIRVFIFY